MRCEKLCHGGVISKQNPHTETLQKPHSNFTSNTHPFRLKITSKTYFNYFLYSEYQLNHVNLIKSYVKIDLSYREISILLNDKGCRSDNGTVWNRITVNMFIYKFRKSYRETLSLVLDFYNQHEISNFKKRRKFNTFPL